MTMVGLPGHLRAVLARNSVNTRIYSPVWAVRVILDCSLLRSGGQHIVDIQPDLLP